MGKLWLNMKNELIKDSNGGLWCGDYCPCPCIGFPGFINQKNKYQFFEYRDWDDCFFGKNTVLEGGKEVDGHVRFVCKPGTRNLAVVVESTGNYATRANWKVGTVVERDSFYGVIGYPSSPLEGWDIMGPRSDTLYYSSITNAGCGNGDRSQIYAILFNSVDEVAPAQDDEEFE